MRLFPKRLSRIEKEHKRCKTTALFFVLQQSFCSCPHLPRRRKIPPASSTRSAYGAKGDGKTLDTNALQDAIDACAKSGGGRVTLAGGTFLSGTLVLKSGVNLEIEAGATLLGSTELDNYPPHVPELRSYTDNYTDKSLIYAEKQEHVSLTGLGTIDGQGGDSAFRQKPYKQRPYLLRIIECKNVAVRGVTLKNSPMWTQHYLGCEGVLIDGVTVHSLVNGNNDGIDIDSCEKVRIANCNINSIDDGICLKATADRPCRYVTVTNCVVRSLCNGIKCGTESNGGFQDIAVSNCAIYDTPLAGIALEEVDGGDFERVVVSGITMKNVRGGIFVRLGNRARPITPQSNTPKIGSMKDIIIRDVQAAGVSAVGCSVTGQPGHPVRNITLENIRIQYRGGRLRRFDQARSARTIGQISGIRHVRPTAVLRLLRPPCRERAVAASRSVFREERSASGVGLRRRAGPRSSGREGRNHARRAGILSAARRRRCADPRLPPRSRRNPVRATRRSPNRPHSPLEQ